MKKTILLLLVFSFILVGCAPKTQVVFRDKLVCVEQQSLVRHELVHIRVHKADKDVAIAYKQSIDSSLDFYENQVSRNNKFCKEIIK